MRRFAQGGSVDPVVRQLALAITDGIAGRSGEAQAAAIRAWLDQHVQFVRDPDGAELLIRPREAVSLLRLHGPPLRIDCDDVAVLAAALGKAVGLRARFVLVGFGPRKPQPFRHVWTELSDPVRRYWIGTDVTRAQQPLPPAINRRVAIHV